MDNLHKDLAAFAMTGLSVSTPEFSELMKNHSIDIFDVCIQLQLLQDKIELFLIGFPDEI